MNKTASPKKRRSLIPYTLFIVGGFFLWTIFRPISETFDQGYFQDFWNSHDMREENNINLPREFLPEIQTNKFSSGYTVIAMISTLMGKPANQQDVMDKFEKKGKRGMFPSTFVYYLRSYLPGYHISLVHPTNETVLKGIIYHQLNRNLPIPVLISSTNHLTKRQRITLNYSLIIGFNGKSGIVTLADTFGKFEKLSLKELQNRLNFKNYRNTPLSLQIAIALNLYQKNNIFLIVDIEELSMIL